jgi:hypothetical protein
MRKEFASEGKSDSARIVVYNSELFDGMNL